MRNVLCIAALALASLGCRAAPRARDAVDARPAATVDALYRSFCWDAGGEPDWAAMRALFAEGAAFVAPGTSNAVGADAFHADFAAFAATEPLASSGFHERITHARLDAFGGVAHAYVVFEGFVPGEDEPRSRGLDSIQLVRDGERWLVVSFTTQYETRDERLPRRFFAEPWRGSSR